MTEMERTELLVIGAGPYGLATAAHAKRQGIKTLVLGNAMSFWRENMPAKMMLRSGPDWHLDVAQEHTLMAFLTERGLDPAEVDPIPIALFLEYADWFREMAGVETDPDLVENLVKPNGDFEAALKSGPASRPPPSRSKV
jgi:cation diffusion facilitator CzcD-associated flavoprotein CzcO